MCGLPWWLNVKKSSCQCRRHKVGFLCQEDPLDKEMATHSSILAWGIPWTEKPGGLQFMALQRVGHDLVIKQTTKSNLAKNPLVVVLYFQEMRFWYFQ